MELPKRSPPAEIFAHVGLTDLSLSYNSPAVQGRDLWGKEIPFRRPWRTGDHPAARLTLSRDITIADSLLSAGSYALVFTPGKEAWTVSVCQALGNSVGSDKRPSAFRPGAEVARFDVPALPASHRERLAFFFADATQDGVVLVLEWNDVRLAIPVTLHTQAQLQEGLEDLDGLPASYLQAARYMLEVRHEYALGLRYVDDALALKPDWQALLLKAALLASLGDQKRAKAVSAEAYEMRRRQGEEGPANERHEKIASISFSRPTFASVSGRSPARRSSGATAGTGGAADDGRFVRASGVQTRQPVAIPREQFSVQIDAADEPLPLDDLGGRRARQAPREPRNTNPLSSDEISRILQNGKQDIQICYQQALRQDPAFTRARISTAVTIGLSGRPRKIVLESRGGLGPIEPCLKETVGRWAFPVGSGEYEVRFPLVLRGRE